jgi:hypothetical protein
MRESATIANNVLMAVRKNFGAGRPYQCRVLGIFGRNTASRPIAGRKAQTW